MLGVIVVMGGSIAEIIGYILLAAFLFGVVFSLTVYLIKDTRNYMAERQERWVREYEAANKRTY